MVDDTAYEAAIEKRQAEEKRKFIEALREMPIIARVCKMTGTARTTYYRWRKEDGAFASECDETWRQGIEFMNDMSESQMLQLVGEKSLPAIKHWLAHNSSRYQSPMVMRIKQGRKPVGPSLMEVIKRLNESDTNTNEED